MAEFELINDNGVIKEIPKRDSNNTNITPRNLKSFNITKDYIQSLIPDNIRDTWTFERVADLIYAVISDETETGKEVNSYYNDIEYFNTDITKLTIPMKEHKLNDLGFSYLSELYQDEESLNNLGVFLNLIKVLKGDIRGFELILQLLGLNCEVTSWEDNKELEIFTMGVLFKTSGETLTVNKTANDLVIEGKKYFDWNGYYTTNPTEPNYELNKLVKLFGTNYPDYSSLTGEMSKTSTQGYPYIKLNQDFHDLILTVKTTDNIDNIEFFRCLDYSGIVISSLTSTEGKLGSYELASETTYQVRLVNLENNSYGYSIKSEDETAYTTLGVVTLEDDQTLDSVDLCRVFDGSIHFANSYITDSDMIQVELAHNITDDYTDDRPYVLNGDLVYYITDSNITPLGVVLNVNETNGVIESLVVSLSSANSYADASMLKKIQKLARSYLAPMVNIEFDVAQDITISNHYFSVGLLKSRNYRQLEITRSL